MIKNTNNGTLQPPALRIDINYGTCEDLPNFSVGPKGSDAEKHVAIAKAGFEGIQDGHLDLCQKLGLKITAHARVNHVGDLDVLLPVWKEKKYDCATVHLGWGMESDVEIDTLVQYIINCSATYDIPIYIETHRATITQDMQRTVELIKRFPEVRFNADFSHWYTGQEMVYGGIENKWNFIQPVFDRVRFIHARIGNPGAIQVNVNALENKDYVSHFKQMWKRSFSGFLKSANPGDYICFTVELLKSEIYYQPTMLSDKGLEEEIGDRWQQALLYKEIATACWQQAQNEFQSN